MASSVYFATGFVYAETTQEDKDNNLLNLEVFNTAQNLQVLNYEYLGLRQASGLTPVAPALGKLKQEAASSSLLQLYVSSRTLSKDQICQKYMHSGS